MTTKETNKIIAILNELDGDHVLRLLTDYHGLQLIDDGFKEFLVYEGILPENG